MPVQPVQQSATWKMRAPMIPPTTPQNAMALASASLTRVSTSFVESHTPKKIPTAVKMPCHASVIGPRWMLGSRSMTITSARLSARRGQRSRTNGPPAKSLAVCPVLTSTTMSDSGPPLRSTVITADPSTRNPASLAPNDPRDVTVRLVTTSKELSSVPAQGETPQPAGVRPPTHQISLVPGRHSAVAPSKATSCRFCGSASGHQESELVAPESTLSSTKRASLEAIRRPMTAGRTSVERTEYGCWRRSMTSWATRYPPGPVTPATMSFAPRSQTAGSQNFPLATFSVAPVATSTVQSSLTWGPGQISWQPLSIATTRPAPSDDHANVLPNISRAPVKTVRSLPLATSRTCRTGPLLTGAQYARNRPSGETVRERDVHDLPSGMKDVITMSLVSLRTLAFPWPSAMTNPKRPSSTPAVGDG